MKSMSLLISMGPTSTEAVTMKPLLFHFTVYPSNWSIFFHLFKRYW